MAFDYVGINIYWKGKGINEKVMINLIMNA